MFDVIDSVVSVWSNNSVLLGTAFAIGPNLLLTAKHVVLNLNTMQLYPNLSLHLFGRIDNLPLEKVCIHYHEKWDVALIKLTDHYEKQPFCQLEAAEKKDWQGHWIEFHGINRTNQSPYSSSDYKIGGLLPNRGYLFDHQVLKGFSGSAVVSYRQDKVIGVISMRDPDDQQTLFIPVQYFLCWLKELGYRPNHPASSLICSVPEYLSRSARFIDRPKQSYINLLEPHFAVSAVAPLKQSVSIDVCLYQDTKDAPSEFADVLSCKLFYRTPEQINLDLIGNNENHSSKPINKIDLWRAGELGLEDDFFRECLSNICAALPDLQINCNDDDSATQICQNILAVLQGGTYVFHATSIVAASASAADIAERIRLTQKFKALWKDCIQSLPSLRAEFSLVIVFFLKIRPELAADCEHKLSLQTIDQDGFTNWIEELDAELRKDKRTNKLNIGEPLNDFIADFNDHAGVDAAFQMRFLDFRRKVKQLTGTA